MSMKKALIVLLAGVVLPLASVFASETKMTAADSPIVIGMSVPWLQYGSYFGVMRSGVEKTAAELGARIVFADAVADPMKQAADVRNFVAQGVQGILVSPMEPASLASAIEAAVRAGIPIASVSTLANTQLVLVNVCGDNVQGGRAAARFIIEKLGNKGSVIELEGPFESPDSRARKSGFEEVIKKSNVKILVSQIANWDRYQAQKVMAGLIRNYPDFDAVFGINDEMIIGAIEAMSAARIDLSKKVTVGYDAIPDAFLYMKDGKLSATIDGFSAKQAGQALQYLLDYIKNKTKPPKQLVLINPELVTKAPVGPGS
jgi:ribose transport system substrate-binding protein